MIHFMINIGSNSLTTVPIGVVTGGYRLQLTYGDGITFKGRTTNGETLIGKVVAGTDLVLLRDDGVAEFDAKITFQADEPRHHTFDGELRGRVDLRSIGFSNRIRNKTDLEKLNKSLFVTLPIQFETADPNVPPGGPFAEAAKNATPFADLARHQFLAMGQFNIERGQFRAAALTIVSAGDLAVADTLLRQLSDKAGRELVGKEVQALSKKIEDKLVQTLDENRKGALKAAFGKLRELLAGSAMSWDEVRLILGQISDSSPPPPLETN